MPGLGIPVVDTGRTLPGEKCMKFLKNRMFKLAALIVTMVAIGFFVFTFTYGCQSAEGTAPAESDIMDVAPNDVKDVAPNDSEEGDAPGMLDVEESEDSLGETDISLANPDAA